MISNQEAEKVKTEVEKFGRPVSATPL